MITPPQSTCAVEMFLKSLELISTFHPELGSGQMLEVERKMTITKKRAFERWVDKAIRRRQRDETREHRRFERSRSGVLGASGSCWTPPRSPSACGDADGVSGVMGWSLAADRSACPTLALPSGQTGVR